MEMLVVMIIIGVSVAMVAPRFSSSLGRLELKNTARKIAAALRYARSQATSEQVLYRAIIDQENKQIRIGQMADDDDAGEDNQRIDDSESDDGEARMLKGRTYRLPAGVRIAEMENWRGEEQDSPFEIDFYPYGASSGGWLTLMDEAEKTMRIRVDFIAGAVSLAQ